MKIGTTHVIVALGCLSLIYLAFDVQGDGAQTNSTVVAQVRKGVPPRIREQPTGETLTPRDPVQRGVPEPDIGEALAKPDLRPDSCTVLCNRGSGYSLDVCRQYGYSSNFTYKVIASMRNIGNQAAYFAVGWRMWRVIPPSGLEVVPGDVLQSQNAPLGGVSIKPGAALPASRGPMLHSLVLSPGAHSVEFIVDPDNRIAETNEGNNTIKCSWNVVATAPEAPFDLAITKLSVSPAVGPSYENFEITVTVKNLGSAIFDTINTVCRPGGSFYDSGLDANEERTSTYLIPGELSPGIYRSVCTVSAPGYIDSNTSNNTMSTIFSVTPP